ncbi:TPA: hypothetical protein DCL30_04910 [Candidatus Peribacteria bacterium]|nr:hypothetical protein [Candidatus Peribacteria bacterium]HAS34036.1 hypothetical protein [Candidatus Peribacteria bacterium]
MSRIRFPARWEDIRMQATHVGRQVDALLDAFGGVLPLGPAWVHREFCQAGMDLRLHPHQYMPFGPRKEVDERWFASTIGAKNTFRVPNEGLSWMFSTSGRSRFTLAAAVEERGNVLVGGTMYGKYRHWPVYSKYFNNRQPLPHHMHGDDAQAALVGLPGKPESYYWPPEYNMHRSADDGTMIGLRPGTTREQLRNCLLHWGTRGHDIRFLTMKYAMKVGRGWRMPARRLHAPAALCTYEPQWRSDVFNMFQGKTEDGWLDRSVLLFKDVPQQVSRDQNVDHMVEMIDWPGNLADQSGNQILPIFDESRSGIGVTDMWVVYGTFQKGGEEKELFSAKRLDIDPGAETTLRDPGASGMQVLAGSGVIGKYEVQAPYMLRDIYDVPRDECFIPYVTATSGLKIRNTGLVPLTLLRYFGPDVWGNDMPRLQNAV